MSVVGIVQARAGSSRLPGKVLRPINGVPMLVKVLSRMARSERLDRIVLATTTEAGDDPVADLALSTGALVARGDAFDVLDRFHTALQLVPDATVVVRVTADCPFIDPGIIDDVIALRERERADFAANRLPPPAPRTYPVGLDVEVCTVDALERAWREAERPFEREHVMPYLYSEPSRFRVVVAQLDEDLSGFRWTVDEPADLAAAEALDAACGPEPYDWRHVLDIARARPDITAINAGLGQKHVTDVDSRWNARGSDQPSR
jgi:spore coat polysaccharide biosynthesis protein SpsF